jgi:F-type H+-transporting ATPase subunit b
LRIERLLSTGIVLIRGLFTVRLDHHSLDFPMNALIAASPLAPDVIGFTTAIIVFLAFFIVTAKLVWPKIIAGLDERYAKIRGEIDAAEAARHEAQSAQKKFEEKLQQAQAEAAATIAAAQAIARKAGDELRARNEAELADMRARAVADIQAAKENAVKELNDHAVGLATTMASKILRREVSAGDQSRLVTESLAELARGRN